MTRKDKTDYLIQSVSFACELMDQFRSADRELSIADLCQRLRINKNYVFRLLKTLERRNFVERNPQTGTFRLGLNTMQIGESCCRSKRIIREAHGVLDRMASLSGETSMLHVLSNGALVCVDSVESPLPVRVRVAMGSSVPLHSTAAGRVVSAFVEPADDLVAPGNHPDGYSVSRLNGLQQIRAQGYAVSYGEFKPDVCAVAAPVLDYRSRVIGVVGVAGPSSRLALDRLDREIAPLVVKSAHDLSAGMGFVASREAASLVQACEQESVRQPGRLFPLSVPGDHASDGSRYDLLFGIRQSAHRLPEVMTAAA